jgi:hypothetical protein
MLKNGRRLAFAIAFAASSVILASSSCNPGHADEPRPNTKFSTGVTVETGFRVRDENFSKVASLDSQSLTTETAISAIQATPQKLFIGTSNRGVFESTDKGRTWNHYNVRQIPMITDVANQRQIYAVDSRLHFITHKHDILIRANDNAGAWQPVVSNMGRSVIFTAIHHAGSSVYLGTSVNGLKVAHVSPGEFAAGLKNPAGMHLKFRSISGGLPGKPHNKSHFLFEEVTAVQELADGDLLVATGPAPALFLKPRGSARFRKVDIRDLGNALDECPTLSVVSRSLIALSCRRGFWFGSLSENVWTFTPHTSIISDLADYGAYAMINADGLQLTYVGLKSYLTPEKKKRMELASGQRTMYASAYTWQKRQLAVLAELKHEFWTALVIDAKDDGGYLRFDSEVPLALKIGAVRPLYKMADVVQKVHALGKKVIVRLVIFKDPKLFHQPGYAIMDAGGGKWIGTPGERWIDPYNPHLLTDYYAPLMRELTAKGVDEIQLDYIRFPSDGRVGRCRYSHKKSDHYNSEALENFLMGVRAATPLPIGADIYGYNGMYRVPGIIGQDLTVYGRVLDIISPMDYSSHFGDDYMRHLPRDERTYQLLLLAISRGVYHAHGEFIIRPYIQAFPMKNGIWGYGKKYFADQIKGAADGGGNGFLFWGQLDHMSLVRRTQSET